MRSFPELEAQLSDGTISLRRFTLGDVEDVARACQDLEIVRWTASIPIPYRETDAHGWIERHADNWSSGTTTSLAIVDASDGAFLGAVNVIVPPSAVGRVAVGYWVAEWGRRQGVATGALRITSKWVIDNLEPQELFLETLDGNIASERVAEKAGYVFAGYRSTDFTRPASRGMRETLRVKEWVLSPSTS